MLSGFKIALGVFSGDRDRLFLPSAHRFDQIVVATPAQSILSHDLYEPLQHGLRLGAREERQFRARFQEALGNGRRRWPGWRRAASQRPDPDSQE